MIPVSEGRNLKAETVEETMGQVLLTGSPLAQTAICTGVILATRAGPSHIVISPKKFIIGLPTDQSNKGIFLNRDFA